MTDISTCGPPRCVRCRAFVRWHPSTATLPVVGEPGNTLSVVYTDCRRCGHRHLVRSSYEPDHQAREGAMDHV